MGPQFLKSCQRIDGRSALALETALGLAERRLQDGILEHTADVDFEPTLPRLLPILAAMVVDIRA